MLKDGVVVYKERTTSRERFDALSVNTTWTVFSDNKLMCLLGVGVYKYVLTKVVKVFYHLSSIPSTGFACLWTRLYLFLNFFARRSVWNKPEIIMTKVVFPLCFEIWRHVCDIFFVWCLYDKYGHVWAFYIRISRDLIYRISSTMFFIFLSINKVLGYFLSFLLFFSKRKLAYMSPCCQGLLLLRGNGKKLSNCSFTKGFKLYYKEFILIIKSTFTIRYT